MDEDLEELEGTIENLLENDKLKWVFVGGKGGVGKTTCSSSIAILLAKVRKSVLLISTDPAHNLSDAFGQKFTKEPTKIDGFDNLFAMEIDPKVEPEDLENIFSSVEGAEKNQLGSLIQNLTSSLPGIDEAMSFAEVMKLVKLMDFSVIVFDTAPTGHTLRLLSFPTLLDSGLAKLITLKSKFSSIFSQFSTLFNISATEDQVTTKMEKTKELIVDLNKQFKNPELTTFVCVCIPEFLSLYETERLVQELTKYEIDTQNIIINQVLYPEGNCDLCNSRAKMQNKYIEEIYELYEDFHVTALPLLKEEVRGVDALKEFSKHLLKPYKEKK